MKLISLYKIKLFLSKQKFKNLIENIESQKKLLKLHWKTLEDERKFFHLF